MPRTAAMPSPHAVHASRSLVVLLPRRCWDSAGPSGCLLPTPVAALLVPSAFCTLRFAPGALPACGALRTSLAPHATCTPLRLHALPARHRDLHTPLPLPAFCRWVACARFHRSAARTLVHLLRFHAYTHILLFHGSLVGLAFTPYHHCRVLLPHCTTPAALPAHLRCAVAYLPLLYLYLHPTPRTFSLHSPPACTTFFAAAHAAPPRRCHAFPHPIDLFGPFKNAHLWFLCYRHTRLLRHTCVPSLHTSTCGLNTTEHTPPRAARIASPRVRVKTFTLLRCELHATLHGTRRLQNALPATPTFNCLRFACCGFRFTGSCATARFVATSPYRTHTTRSAPPFTRLWLRW